MKKILFALVLMLAIASVATAQPVKGSYTKAQAFLVKGEVAEAKKYIDAAIEDPKQADKSKTWLVKGQVYQAIALSDDAAIQALSPNALDEALSAYAKVKTMEKPGSTTMKELEETQGVDFTTGAIRPSIIEEFKGAYFNKGITQYNEEDYTGAMASFEKCYKITPMDTLAALYALTCAEIAEDGVSVERNARALIGMNYTDVKLYIAMARNAYRAENWAKVLEISKEGRAANPSDTNLIKFMTDAYIRMGKKEEAIGALEESVKNDPSDKLAWFSLGTLFDELKEYEKADAAFQKAIAADPAFFSSYFNYFVMINNQIAEKGAALEALVDSKGRYTDEAKAKKLNEDIDALRKKALPNLIKANELDPNEASVLANIVFIYRKLNMDKEALQYAEKLYTLDPLNRGVLVDLSYLYEKGNQSKKVDDMYNKSMALGEERLKADPNNVAIIESLAYIYDMLDMKEKAKAMNARLDALD